MLNFNKYCSQLDQVKATLDENHPELVNRKHLIFHQDSIKATYFFDDRQKQFTAWLGNSDSTTVFSNVTAFRFPFILLFIKFS